MQSPPSSEQGHSPDKKKLHTEKIPKRLLPMSGIRRIIARIRQEAGAVSVILAIAGGAGHWAGSDVQSWFRDKFDYDPDKIEKPADDKEPSKSSKKDDPDKEKPDEDKSFLKKKWEEISDEAKKIEVAKDIMEMLNVYKKLKSLYDSSLSYGDKTAYWGPFIAVAWLMYKLLKKMRNSYKGPIDPIVVENIKRLEAMVTFQAKTIGELEARLEKLSPLELGSQVQEAQEAVELVEVSVRKIT